MSRYVDIEGDWVDDAVKAYSLGYYDDDEYAIPFEALGSAPSIEIIHCRECKHYEDPSYKIFENCVKWKESHGIILPIKPNDFCSYGCREEE